MGPCHHLGPSPSPGAAALAHAGWWGATLGRRAVPSAGSGTKPAAADCSWEELWAWPRHREREEAAEKSPLALLCHHSLLTAAGASGPRAPLQERVGAGWLVYLSPHAANCSNPRVPGHRPHCPTPQPFTQFLGKSGVRVEGLEQRLWAKQALPGVWAAPETLVGGRWAGLSGNGV